jgi:hypothetical protein
LLTILGRKKAILDADYTQKIQALQGEWDRERLKVTE